ncbi:Putative lipid II flippase FtsW [Bacillus velezensis]|nr:Putative lipid II flippase FtsW [Bacillus velezensis]
MFKRMLKSYDYSLICAIILLCSFGLVMVYSSSMITAVMRYGVSSDYFFKRQLFAVIAGFVLFIIAAVFPYKVFAHQKIQKFVLLASVAALCALFVSDMLPETRKAGLKSAEWPFSRGNLSS